MERRARRWDPRFSVSSLSTQSWSLRQDLDLYERLDIRRVTLFLPKLIEAGLDQAMDEIVGRHLHVDGVLPGAAFDLTDESGWAEVRESMVLAVETAQRLGAHTLPTAGGSARGQSYEWAVDRFSRAIEPIVAAARPRGVRVAVEPTRPQFAHLGFVHTLRDGLALACELDLWVVPDTTHVWWEPDLPGLLAAGASRIALFQVADLAFAGPVLERLVPGDGEIPLGPLMGAAVAAGFTGPFEIEILGAAIETEGYEDAVRRSYEHLEGLVQD
ncbi:MAG: hypothetical protein QOJ44_143 [Acidimicrobiaceae bacterium]|nr:hypothetical protein [Acidimicrobiaceae bacterium]